MIDEMHGILELKNSQNLIGSSKTIPLVCGRHS